MSYVKCFNVLGKTVSVKEKTGIHNIKGYCYGYKADANLNEQTQSLFVFITPSDKVIMFDCGYKDETENIKLWFKKIGVTKIDYCAISHYHLDHAGGLETLVSFLDFNGCKLFLPQNLIADDPRISPTIYDLEEKVKRIASINNMEIIQPNIEGSEYNVEDGISIIFHNVYHNNYYLSDNFNYNNCSLTPILKNGENKLFYSADINIEAQMFLASVLPVCNIATICHHGYNRNCYKPYFNNLNYKVAIAPNGKGMNSTDPDKTLNTIKTFSGESYLAEERGIPIYATSDVKDYIVSFTMTPDKYIAHTKEIPRTRIIKEYNSLNEVMNLKGSIVGNAYKVQLTEFLDLMDNNSHILCNVKPKYDLCPARMTSGCILEINKSNSSFDSEVFEDTTRAVINYYDQLGTSLSQVYTLFGVKHGTEDWKISMANCSRVEAYRYGDKATASGNLTLKDFFGNTIENSKLNYACLALVTGYFVGSGVFELTITRDNTDYPVMTMNASSEYKSECLLFGFQPGDTIKLTKKSGTTITYNIGIVPITARWDLGIADLVPPLAK